jgi:hypothetical protein
MTESTHSAPATKSPSRRAMLAGALGGLGAWAATAIGRASPVRAADGDIIHVGDELTGSSVTRISTAIHAFWGDSDSGIGVTGTSNSNTGVYGRALTGFGVWGDSNTSDRPAVIGRAQGDGTGLFGFSGSSNVLPPVKAKTGVYGVAQQDSASRGVYGFSPRGHAIHGESDAGWAGWFDGKVFTNRFIEFAEVTANPRAPGANRAKIFARDNGSGRTQLCVRFHNGTIRVLATA